MCLVPGACQGLDLFNCRYTSRKVCRSVRSRRMHYGIGRSAGSTSSRGRACSIFLGSVRLCGLSVRQLSELTCIREVAFSKQGPRTEHSACAGAEAHTREQQQEQDAAPAPRPRKRCQAASSSQHRLSPPANRALHFAPDQRTRVVPQNLAECRSVRHEVPARTLPPIQHYYISCIG